MRNIGAILKASGSSYDRVVKTTVLLADIADFKTVNGIYATCARRPTRPAQPPLSRRAPTPHAHARAALAPADFPSNPPARSTFAVKDLPLGSKVEIEAIALCD